MSKRGRAWSEDAVAACAKRRATVEEERSSLQLEQYFARQETAHTVLQFLNCVDATALRAVSKTCRDAVAAQPWDDVQMSVNAVRQWVACFPRATHLHLGAYADVFAWGECAALRHVTSLDVTSLWQTMVMPFAAFRHVQKLYACECGDLTDACIASLLDMRVLHVDGCDQLTDAALSPLARLEELSALDCEFGDSALHPHAPLRVLMVNATCTMTDATLARFPRLQTLDLQACDGFSPAGIASLHHLEHVSLVADAAALAPFVAPATLTTLMLYHAPSVAHAGLLLFAHLTRLEVYQEAHGCMTDAVLLRMPRLQHLTIDMERKRACAVSDASIGTLRELRTLRLRGAKFEGVTDAGLAPLRHLQVLCVDCCSNITLCDVEAWDNLHHLTAWRTLAPDVLAAIARVSHRLRVLCISAKDVPPEMKDALGVRPNPVLVPWATGKFRQRSVLVKGKAW